MRNGSHYPSPALLLAALSLAIVLFSAVAAPAAAGGEEYVCPMPEHAQVFDHPGTCPICGMELVKKQPGLHRTRVAILVFNGTELVDFTAPFEVFGDAGFEVFLVAPTADPVRIATGIELTPTYTFATSPDPDVVIVPGGNVQGPLHSAETEAWLRAKAPGAKIVMSICNGAFIVAKAGLLDGLSATTTYGHIDELAAAAPRTKVVREQRYVDNGKVITTAGLTAGMDGSLHVVERLLGRDLASRIALGLEYHWQPDSPWARPSLADRYLPHLDAKDLGEFEETRSEGDADHWQTEATTPAPPTPELVEEIARRLAAATKWQRDDGASPTEKRFHFADDKNRRWEAVLSIAPRDGGSGARLRFELRRATPAP
jgi:putative intracellular protease/amidase